MPSNVIDLTDDKARTLGIMARGEVDRREVKEVFKKTRIGGGQTRTVTIRLPRRLIRQPVEEQIERVNPEHLGGKIDVFA